MSNIAADRHDARLLVRTLTATPDVLGEDRTETVNFLLDMEEGIVDLVLAQPTYVTDPKAALKTVVDLLAGESVEHFQTVVLLDKDNTIIAVEEGFEDITSAHYFGADLRGVPVGDLLMHGLHESTVITKGTDPATVVSGHSIHLVDARTGATLTTLTSTAQRERQEG